MHFDTPTESTPATTAVPWYKLLNRYHWFVLVVCTLGWLFDTMDQQLFTIARNPAMRALAPKDLADADKPAWVAQSSGDVTSVFLIGWGVGGLAFGVLGDIIGRARSMVLTILLYSLFTGLSALSFGFWDFAVYRFLTGLGVGGQFAVGVSLVAEVMPAPARTPALGLLQALSAIGNVSAALFGIFLAFLGRNGVIEGTNSWRYMFFVGTVPALLVLVIMRRLKEPEKWTALSAEKTIRERLRAYSGELLSDRRWSYNAIVGLLLASSGIIGLWAIGFFAVDFVREIIRPKLQAEGLSASDAVFWEDVWASVTSIVLNVGAFFGIFAFSKVAGHFGRRPAFAVSFVLAFASTALVFGMLNSFDQIFWMIPLMGFCQLALFGGYAIYFPELFPTRLRSTGISFCYNGARFVAATGPFVQGHLRAYFRDLAQSESVQSLGLAGSEVVQGFRLAGITMCAIFIVGLLVVPFAPETKGKPLPE